MDLLQDGGMTRDDVEVVVNGGAFMDGCSGTRPLWWRGEGGRGTISKYNRTLLRGSNSGMARHVSFSS